MNLFKMALKHIVTNSYVPNAGDMRVAMETLLTAIAVIKQSRVYGDERCQTLVTSLKDCLVSIQGNYSSRCRLSYFIIILFHLWYFRTHLVFQTDFTLLQLFTPNIDCLTACEQNPKWGGYSH